MRHGKKFNHLGRTDSHRKAMLSNMASSLIRYKRITTTLAKAKALRKYVEPLITKSKSDTTHSRRTVFSYLKDKESVAILFREVSEKVADRPGGYTRIIKLENRFGDNAEMAIVELVDYNEVYVKGDVKAEKKSTRRRGRKKSSSSKEATPDAKQNETADEVAQTETEEQVDDLTKIEGIGPKIAEVLGSAGITSFVDLAAKESDELKSILTDAGDQFNTAVPDSWSEQAQLAAEGKFDELKELQDKLDGGKDVEEGK